MSSASEGLRPSDPLTIIFWCRRAPTLLCSLYTCPKFMW